MPTPKEIALSSVSSAAAVIARTRQVLGELLSSLLPDTGIIPQPVLIEFDKVWAHFTIPKGFPITTMGLFPPINNLREFLQNINNTYVQMANNLTLSATLFHDLPTDWFGTDVHAFTLGDTRTPEEPPKGPNWPNGIYFKAKFVNSTGPKRIEVIVHECAHFPKNQLIQDNAQPGDTKYKEMPSYMALMNAWSYSQFALDCAFNRRVPF